MKIIAILPISSLLILISHAYDENSCAYFSTHYVATPLSACTGVSTPNYVYSWNFMCDDAENIHCNYFYGDTQCNDANAAGTTPIDKLAGVVQCKGSGDNCHTVDIKVSGYTDPSNCDEEDDYTTYSFVIEECIPNTLVHSGGQMPSSARMSCDAEKLYFEYYSGTNDCTGDMETYTYEYFADIDGCWDIECGLHRQEGEGTYSEKETEQPPEEAPACELEVNGKLNYMGHNHKEMGRKLVEMLTKPNLMDMTKAKFYESKTKVFAANVINDGPWDEVERGSGFVINRIIMNWIYIVAVACAVILIAGAWRFIKEKEYTIL